MIKYIFTVSVESTGERLDKFLSDNIKDMSRSSIANLIEQGAASVNSVVKNKKYKICENDQITFSVPKLEKYSAKPEDIPLDICYEDDDLLIVNKPKGMVVHPAAGNYSGTLVNALLFHCKSNLSGINGEMRPGIIHRIDKDTSGLLIVAKNDISHIFLANQIKEHTFTREYETIVIGNIKNEEGVVNAPIGRHHTNRKKMTVTDKNSKNAITYYYVLQRYNGYTHLKCKLETGRTHQIRAHMAYLGHPVAGDTVYGSKKPVQGLNGQCLHAKKIGFIHPKNKKYMEFETELPKYFKNFISKISNC